MSVSDRVKAVRDLIDSNVIDYQEARRLLKAILNEVPDCNGIIVDD